MRAPFTTGSETSPQVHHIPKIVVFLGYDSLPPPEDEDLPARLIRCRKSLGLSQRAFALKLGVDPTTLRLWEKRKRRLSKKLSARAEVFLKNC